MQLTDLKFDLFFTQEISALGPQLALLILFNKVKAETVFGYTVVLGAPN